ncbi:hypothetical protein [Streptomyces lutosisoli]
MGNASLLFTGAFSVRRDDVFIVSSGLSRDISWNGRGTEDHALQRCPVGKFEDRALILALTAAAPATTSSVQLASSTAPSFHTREAPPSHVCRHTALPAAAEPSSTPAHSPLRADFHREPIAGDGQLPGFTGGVVAAPPPISRTPSGQLIVKNLDR